MNLIKEAFNMILLLVSNIFGISVIDILLNYINYFIKYIII